MARLRFLTLIPLPGFLTRKGRKNGVSAPTCGNGKERDVCFTAGGGDRDRERAPMMDAYIATLQASDLAQGRFLTYRILVVIDSRQAVAILYSKS